MNKPNRPVFPRAALGCAVLFSLAVLAAPGPARAYTSVQADAKDCVPFRFQYRYPPDRAGATQTRTYTFYRRKSDLDKRPDRVPVYADSSCERPTENGIIMRGDKQVFDWKPPAGSGYGPVQVALADLTWPGDVTPRIHPSLGGGPMVAAGDVGNGNTGVGASKPAPKIDEKKTGSRGAAEKDPINEITDLFSREGGRADAVDRINGFLWEEGRYTSLDAEKSSATKRWIAVFIKAKDEELPASARTAIESMGFPELASGDIPALYYILGASPKLLESIPEDGRSILKGRTDLKGKLVECLGDYTASGSQGAEKWCYADIRGTGELTQLKPEWVKGFLTDAAKTAALIYQQRNDIHAPAPEREDGRRDGERGGESGRRRTGPGGIDLSEPFGVDALFGKWGDVNVIHVPSDPVPEGTDPRTVPGRTLALVIRTQRTIGEDGRPKYVQQLGVYDITHSNDIYGRRFTIKPDGSEEFTLSEGGAKYKLSFTSGGDDIKLGFEKTGGDFPIACADGREGPPSVNELYRDRARKALEYGNYVEVGGKRYLVSGESSNKGSLLFWDEEKLLEMEDARPDSLVPEMMAYVNQKGEDNRVGPLSGDNDLTLGKVDGEYYKLQWNEELGFWEPVKGGGFTAPPKPQTPGTKRQGPPQQNTTPRSPGVQQGQKYPDGWPNLEGVAPPIVLWKAMNDALDASLQGKVKFYWCHGCRGDANDPKGTMMFDKDPVKRTGLIYLGDRPAEDSARIIGGHVLATNGGGGVLYVDLSKGIPMVHQGKASIFNFDEAIVGRRLAGAFEQVTDKDVLKDCLSAFKLSEDKILGRLQTCGGSGAYEASGAAGYVEIARGGKKYQIWPEECKEVAGGNPSQVTDPGFILDHAAVRTAESLSAAPPKPQGTPETAEVAYEEGFAAQKDARIIRVTEGDGDKTTKKWYLFFLVEHKDRNMTFPPVQIFEDPPTDRYPFPGKGRTKVAGVSLPEKVKDPLAYARGFKIGTPLQRRNDSLPAKGWVAVYDAEAANVRGNCVDVVLWWGYASRDEARQECKYSEHSLRKSE